MPAVTEKLTSKVFRELYADRKPYFELLDGEPVQKPVPTRLHGLLTKVLLPVLDELGFRSIPELTLPIDDTWEPIPDVSATIGTAEDPYPTHAVSVAVEVLSPDDRFTRVVQKCKRYAEWGVSDILVFDPVAREAWFWDHNERSLRPIRGTHQFQSRPVQLDLADVFGRLDDELRQ